MGENRLIVAKDFSSCKSPRRSLTIIDGFFSRKSSFVYNKLPSKPLTLTVLKLDGSTFDIKVAKTATIAELKEAVEAVFSYMPQQGPGKISWPHVWGQFCLCYDGQKLVTENDYLRDYGIKDGDQLHFIRHISSSYIVQRKRLKKHVVLLKLQKRSLSQVNSYQPKEHSDDDDGNYSDEYEAMENGKIRVYREGSVRKKKLPAFGELFSHTGLRKTRTNSRIFCPSMIGRCLMGSFRKIRRTVCFGRRRQHSRRLAWRQ